MPGALAAFKDIFDVKNGLIRVITNDRENNRGKTKTLVEMVIIIYLNREKQIKQQHCDSEVNVISYHNLDFGIITPTHYQSYRVTDTSRVHVSSREISCYIVITLLAGTTV